MLDATNFFDWIDVNIRIARLRAAAADRPDLRSVAEVGFWRARERALEDVREFARFSVAGGRRREDDDANV